MTARLVFSCVLLSLLVATGACSSDDGGGGGEDDSATDASLCATYCENLPTTCKPAFDELKGHDCNDGCLGADSSTAFRRCLADATSCDDLKACKSGD